MRVIIWRSWAGIAPVLVALHLTACTVYTAKPLEGTDLDAALASPDRAALVTKAAHLSHPRVAALTLDFSKPLNADEVAVIAVIANPDLRALRLQQRVADAQVFAAGLLPDPQLSLGFDKVLSPQDQNLTSAYAAGLTLDLLGPLATHQVERQAARSAAEQVRLDIAWQEWTVAGQARLLTIRLPRQRLAAQLSRAAAISANDTLHHTLAAAARGDLKGDDVEARRIAAADASARAIGAERDAEATRLELNRLLGLTPSEPLKIADPAPLAPWNAPDAEALFIEARTTRLDLQAFAAGYDSQEASLHRAVLGQYPRLSITVNRARDTSNVETVGPAVTFDLPLWNRNRGAIATSAASRDQLRSEYWARLHRTRADIAALVSALNRDERSRSELAAQLPDMDRIAAAMEAAADRGDVARTFSETARASATDKRLAYLTLDQACAEQRLALALAVGRPLSEDIVTP